MTQNKPNVVGKLFQILGFDLLIDKKLQVWVLEVNDHPSLNIYHDPDPMSAKKMEDTDICPVDYHVKSQLVVDTVSLAKQSVATVEATNEFGCLHKIHPVGQEDQIFVLVSALRELFYKVAKISDKSNITSSRFELLANTQLLKNAGF